MERVILCKVESVRVGPGCVTSFRGYDSNRNKLLDTKWVPCEHRIDTQPLIETLCCSTIQSYEDGFSIEN